jgi:phage terminase large subunit GpA-like protein
MLRRGVWVPDGCTVNKAGQIEGTATKAGSDVVGFGPLPSWYSLTETWGSFARAWLRAQKRPRDLQDVVNSYMAECWEVKRVKSDPERVAERITGQVPPKIIPSGALFLTVTVDRQQADGGFNPWVLLAHGADDRVWEIDHGQSTSLLWIWENVMRKAYPCEDQGPDMTPIINAIDSGWATKETYEFCNSRLGVIPCKGSTGDLGGQPYKIVELSDRTRSDSEGQTLMHVNTDFWETSLQSMLEDRLANEPGSLTLANRPSLDLEFMTQLCNATLSDKKDARGNPRLTWTKLHESQPNDYRDCIRYGMALARSWIDLEGLPMRGIAPSNPVPAEEPKPFVRNPVAAQSSSGWVRRGSR